METALLLLITGLFIGLFALIAVVLWMGHRFLKLKENEQAQRPAPTGQNSLAEGKERQEADEAQSARKLPPLHLAGADILKALRSQGGYGHYCSDHSDLIAVGQCAISGEPYCEHCLSNQKDIKLAKKYIDLYLDGQWQEVLMLNNQDITQDAAERIVKVKKHLWLEEGRPMIVQGHYKINVQDDEIEAFTVVIARVEDFERVKEELSFIG